MPNASLIYVKFTNHNTLERTIFATMIEMEITENHVIMDNRVVIMDLIIDVSVRG